jgi:hypothetical protein
MPYFLSSPKLKIEKNQISKKVYMLTSTTTLQIVFFGDLVAFFAGLAAGFFAAAGFLAFGFAAFFSAAGFFAETSSSSKIQRNGW